MLRSSKRSLVSNNSNNNGVRRDKKVRKMSKKEIDLDADADVDDDDVELTPEQSLTSGLQVHEETEEDKLESPTTLLEVDSHNEAGSPALSQSLSQSSSGTGKETETETETGSDANGEVVSSNKDQQTVELQVDEEVQVEEIIKEDIEIDTIESTKPKSLDPKNSTERIPSSPALPLQSPSPSHQLSATTKNIFEGLKTTNLSKKLSMITQNQSSVVTKTTMTTMTATVTSMADEGRSTSGTSTASSSTNSNPTTTTTITPYPRLGHSLTSSAAELALAQAQIQLGNNSAAAVAAAMARERRRTMSLFSATTGLGLGNELSNVQAPISSSSSSSTPLTNILGPPRRKLRAFTSFDPSHNDYNDSASKKQQLTPSGIRLGNGAVRVAPRGTGNSSSIINGLLSTNSTINGPTQLLSESNSTMAFMRASSTSPPPSQQQASMSVSGLASGPVRVKQQVKPSSSSSNSTSNQSANGSQRDRDQPNSSALRRRVAPTPGSTKENNDTIVSKSKSSNSSNTNYRSDEEITARLTRSTRAMEARVASRNNDKRARASETTTTRRRNKAMRFV